MLFETLKQSYVFLGALYFGLICGIGYEILHFFLGKKNKICVWIRDILFSFLSTILFIFCLKLVNYGEFRLYILFAFIVGFILERTTIGFLVEKIIQIACKFFSLVYNKLMKSKFIKRCFGNDRRKSKEIISSD